MRGLFSVIEAATVAAAGRDSTLADMLSLSVPRHSLKSPVHVPLLARISHQRPIFDFPAGAAL